MHFFSGKYSISEVQVLTGLAVQLGLVHPLDQIRDALDAPVHLEVASDEELPGLVDHLCVRVLLVVFGCDFGFWLQGSGLMQEVWDRVRFKLKLQLKGR